MVGRKVINTNTYLTQADIFTLMENNWNKEEYNNFIISRVNNVSQERYIVLPINEHFLCFIYPIKKNLFHKSNGIVLCSYDFTMTLDEEVKKTIIKEISPLSGIGQCKKEFERRNEQKTVVEDVLVAYYEQLNQIVIDNDLSLENKIKKLSR